MFLGQWFTSNLPLLTFTDEDDMNLFSVGGYPSRWSHADELSTLPSPSSSVVDLDSNAGTVETEVLLSSYKGIYQSSPGAVSQWKLNFYWNFWIVYIYSQRTEPNILYKVKILDDFIKILFLQFFQLAPRCHYFYSLIGLLH